MLALTERAVQAIHRVMAGADADVTGLRVMVVPGGCSGNKYKIGFDTAAAAEDTVVEQEGIRIFVDPDSRPLLDGTSMDYVEGLEGSGFVFKNPKAQKTCNCGKSFSC